jgi:DNA polymerase I
LTQEVANPGVRAAAERAAVNMPIQGSAADILKVAMIRLHERLGQRDLDATLILQVHDELVLEVAEADLEATTELLVDTMSHAAELRVPLKVDVSVGKNWMAMKSA